MARRVVWLTVCAAVMVAGWASPVRASPASGEITVLLDGLPVEFDVPPLLQGGRVLVPFRALAEALRIAVWWDDAARAVLAYDGGTSVRLQIGNRNAYLNEIPVVLDTEPTLREGRSLIPLRFFSQAFGAIVDWEEGPRRVKVLSPPRPMLVTGFYALGDQETSSWTNLFARKYPEVSSGNTDLVGVLALGWYSLDVEGNLLTRSSTGWQRPDGWEKVLEAARRFSVGTEMVVHVTDRDGRLSNLLADEAASRLAVASILEESKLYGGVNLDFEGLGFREEGETLRATQQGFTRFVAGLAASLREAGKTLTLTLHAPNSYYRGYDYRALGELADRIIVMAYDYGPMPEPPELVREALDMAREWVPLEKLQLGVSVVGETPESIRIKVGLAKRHGLAGIALWRLGLVSSETWQILRSIVSPRPNNARQ